VIRRRLAAIASSTRDVVGRVVAPFIPEPETTEGAALLGLLLLAVGFAIWPGMLPGAFIVPGGLLVLVTLILPLRRS
jgi:hypothetical protein